MSTLALIPARYASTRFPGKPLATIAGKPMIGWVFERAAQAFEHTYVATDDQRIADAVAMFGGRSVMTSTRHRSGTDRCAEALDKVETSTGLSFDVVINIQGDEPFIDPGELQRVNQLFADPLVDIATLVKPFGPNEDIFNPNCPKVVLNRHLDAIYFSRSPIPFVRGQNQNDWTRKHVFYKHIGLYAYRAQTLRAITKLPQSTLELAESLEQLRWLQNGYRIRTLETNHQTIAVDTPDDLKRVQEMAKNMEKGQNTEAQ